MILTTCLFAGLKFVKWRPTAPQEATPDDQALDYSHEDVDFFVRKCDHSTALVQLEKYLLNPSYI